MDQFLKISTRPIIPALLGINCKRLLKQPEPHGAILAARRYIFAVGTKRDSMNGPFMAEEHHSGLQVKPCAVGNPGWTRTRTPNLYPAAVAAYRHQAASLAYRRGLCGLYILRS